MAFFFQKSEFQGKLFSFHSDVFLAEYWLVEYIIGIVKEHQAIIAILSGISIVVFVVSLLSVPWMICRIPTDYFLDSYFQKKKERSIVVRGATVFVRNILGVGFFFLGFVLLFIPGQGLLTMFLGVLFMDFPGKKRMVKRFAGIEKVQVSLNWIREKRQVPPLRFPIS
jgi:hypothetical protein